MRVVCASGHFNPTVHAGHMAYLRAAKSLGDRLIVIVNSDFQLGLKGAPILLSEAERLDLVRSLRFVDGAVLAVDRDRSVCATLAMLRPHIFANGGDVVLENCREASLCSSLGITAVYGVGGMAKLNSSSVIIGRMRW